jgi:hypothetical protein
MKNVILGLLTISSISFFAPGANAQTGNNSQELPLAELLRTSDCEMEILEPFIFKKGNLSAFGRSFAFDAKTNEQTLRRLPIGRTLKIAVVVTNGIRFKDESIEFGCILGTNNFCKVMGGLTISEIESQSDNSVSIVCREEEIIDI